MRRCCFCAEINEKLEEKYLMTLARLILNSYSKLVQKLEKKGT